MKAPPSAPADVEISLEDPNHSDAVWCLQAYFRELSDRFSAGFEPRSSISADPDELGIDVSRLETNETLKEAQALYAQHGDREVDPFNDEPYAHHWFEKRLR